MAPAERSRTSVKDRALRLLSARSRSREELRRRLVRTGYEDEEVDAALGDLEAVGLIDDERFAREAAERQRRLGMGRRGGLAWLRQKGVDREVAERVVGEVLAAEDDADRAYEVALGRVERLRGLEPEVAYRRLTGFLIRRGYEPIIASTAARRALAEAGGS